MTSNEPDPLDEFHYIHWTAEDQTRYVPGGYHPAIIGDILGEPLQRQYRLMHKLGWGSYSTVWLAQTTDETKAFVSVKITTADGNNIGTHGSHEIEMLQKAAKGQSGDQSYSYALKLLDHFKLHGPNGTHTVIVTEVVVPIDSLPNQPPAWRKTVTYGITQAMTQLHARQIVHGDWHRGNIGVAMPQLARQDPRNVTPMLHARGVTVILPTDAVKQTASLPPYLITPCGMSNYYKKIAGSDPPEMKVLDFGNAHSVGTHLHAYQCAVPAYAPEIILARVFEKRDDLVVDPSTDVYALGVMIFEIVTDFELFLWATVSDLPFRMSRLAGRIPPHWEEWSARYPECDSTRAEKWWAEHWGMLRKGCENDEDTNALIRLLKTVFVLDPAERPTAAQILNDPWFQSVVATGTA